MRELRYTLGQEVIIKEGSVFAETFDAAGLSAIIVSYDPEDEFDYQVQIFGDELPLFVNDDELI